MSIFNDFQDTFGEGFYTGIPDNNGGNLIMKNGVVVDHMSGHDSLAVMKNGKMTMKIPNSNGGEDTYVNGKLQQHSGVNVHGGTDTFASDNHLIQQSTPNSHGGEDLYDNSMHLKAITTPNAWGSEDMLVLDDSSHGNAPEIMNYNDPLVAAHKYKLPMFYFK